MRAKSVLRFGYYVSVSVWYDEERSNVLGTALYKNIPFLQDYTEDLDDRNNSVNYFYIRTPFRITQPLETQLRQRGVDDVFRIGRQDGVILTSTYFQADMQGRFEFVVMAKDPSKGFQDSANVTVSFPPFLLFLLFI